MADTEQHRADKVEISRSKGEYYRQVSLNYNLYGTDFNPETGSVERPESFKWKDPTDAYYDGN